MAGAHESTRVQECPYEKGSDLYSVWGWGNRICVWMEHDVVPDEHSWMIFRPDRPAAEAMLRLSVEYPHIIKKIEDALDFTEKRFDCLSEDDDGAAVVNLARAIEVLFSRVNEGTKVMAGKQSSSRAELDSAAAAEDYDPPWEKHYPQWLRDIAVRVDELILQPQVLERFREKIREWVAEHKAKGPASPVDADGRVIHNPVRIVPVRAYSKAMKYAVLAAIHDRVGEDAVLISPWQVDHNTASDSEIMAAWKAGSAFDALCTLVDDLSHNDQPRIEGALRDVETDLSARAKSSGRKKRKSTKTRKLPPRTVLTTKQSEALSLYRDGYTHAQIADRLRISKSAVGKRIKNAEEVLKRTCGRSVRPKQTLPTDERGQESIGKNDE